MCCTVEPRYNKVLGTMKITLLYQDSHYIRVKKQRSIKSWVQQNYLVVTGFCYIRPVYNEVPLYMYWLVLLINCVTSNCESLCSTKHNCIHSIHSGYTEVSPTIGCNIKKNIFFNMIVLSVLRVKKKCTNVIPNHLTLFFFCLDPAGSWREQTRDRPWSSRRGRWRGGRRWRRRRRIACVGLQATVTSLRPKRTL